MTNKITLQSMHQDVADILHEDITEFSVDDNLIDFGLDSIRAMSLITRWREQGANISFQQAAQNPSIKHWYEIISSSS